MQSPSMTPSPSPSVEPKTETPPSANSASGMDSKSQAKLRKIAFQRLQNNERDAVKGYLVKFIEKDRKAQIIAEQDRFSMLLKKRLEKIEQRVAQGKGSLATTFPDLYNEKVEDRWVRDKLNIYLTGDGHNQKDQDDDEPLPEKPRIKSEIMDHLWEGNEDSIAVKYGRTCKSKVDYEESDDEEDEEEDDDQKPDKPVVGIACQRGYSIRFGFEGLEELRAELRAKAKANATKAKIVVGVAVTPGFAGPETSSKKRKYADEDEDAESKDAKRVKL
ncbi:hypothetical protein LTR85_000369 [Meristemomyces frigidus]|nr:hypothetical protein LTR85_000369 [Meristemomyces frigidus]